MSRKWFTPRGTGGVEANAQRQEQAVAKAADLQQQMWNEATPYRRQYSTRNDQLNGLASSLLGYINGTPMTANSIGSNMFVGDTTARNALGTRPTLQTYSGQLSNPTASMLTPRLNTAVDLSSVTATPGSSATTHLGQLAPVATYSASDMPSAATLLKVLGDNPDPNSVEAKVNQAYNTINTMDLNKEVDRMKAELDADAARKGWTGSNLDRSAKIGLRNYQRTSGARLGAEGVLAGLDAAQTARAYRDTNAKTADDVVMARYLQGLDLESANRAEQRGVATSLDSQDTALRQEAIDRLLKQQGVNLNENTDARAYDLANADLARQNWLDRNTVTSTNRDWFNQDQAAGDQRWLTDQALASQLRDEKTRNMWSAINWLSGDTERLARAGDLTQALNGQYQIANQYGNVADQYQNTANSNSAFWASLLRNAGTAAGMAAAGA